MNRTDIRRGQAGRADRAVSTWLLALLWGLGAALVTLIALWFVRPGTPDASGVAQSALHAAVVGNPDNVASRVAAAIPPGSHVIVGLPVVSSESSQGPVTVVPSAILAASAPRELAPPGAAIAYARNGTWVVATPAPSSTSPMLLAAIVLTGLAGIGGVLLGRRRQEPAPAGGAYWPPVPDGHAVTAPGMEQVTSQELGRLRDGAQQKALLARRVAELMPSLPEAAAWQASKALAEVGVRAVVPDGERFDPAVHYAVGTEPAPRHDADNTIARTIRPGYTDDENILVYPKVVVYADDADGRRQ